MALLFFHTLLFSTTLHLSLSSNPSRLNPILATDSASATISSYIFNGLFKYDKDGKVIVDLAESYQFLTDTKLVINLKRNIQWHDGYEFIADDILFTYQTIISDKIFTPYSNDFKYVKSVTSMDKYTIIVEYFKPYFKSLEIWMMGIIPMHILKDQDIMNSTFNKVPIGTNSYKLYKMDNSGSIELVANDNYYNGKPIIDKIIYHFLPNSSTNFMKLKNREIDIYDLSPIQYSKMVDDRFKSVYNLYETTTFAYTYLGFNLKSEKFAEPLLRKAISLAIDKKEMIELLFFGQGKVSNGPFLPNSIGYNNKVISLYNPRKAVSILESLGYNNQNRFTFTIITNSNNPTRLYAAQIIQQQLKKVNIDVKIKSMEWQAFLNMVVHPRKFDSVLLGWSLSLSPDPKSIWHSDSDVKGGFNFIGYSNKEVDKLIEQTQTCIDKRRLDLLLQQIHEKIANDYPYIFLYIPNTITAVNKKIKNIAPALTGITHNINDWEIK